jgi:NADH-quinone oxidoreductase subunit G
VEVMACPGGCVGGGGQPINCADKEKAKERGKVLHALDAKMPLRYSHENEDVKALYDDFFEKPLSHKAEEFLHTNHFE